MSPHYEGRRCPGQAGWPQTRLDGSMVGIFIYRPFIWLCVCSAVYLAVRLLMSLTMKVGDALDRLYDRRPGWMVRWLTLFIYYCICSWNPQPQPNPNPTKYTVNPILTFTFR